jgi:hypothetical protein
MTKDEALKVALEALEDLGMKHYESTGEVLYKDTFTDIKEALAQPEHGWTPERIAGMARLKEAQDKKLAQLEPVKIAHKHEWFRTGEMKVGQMRCISCGTWGQEEMPQRTWVGLTPQERDEINEKVYGAVPHHVAFHAAIEAKLKEKNT